MTAERDVFDRLFAGKIRFDKNDVIESLIVFGLLHLYKWDRIISRREHDSGPASSAEIQDAADGFTDQQVADWHNVARETLAEYVYRHSERRRRRVFWFGVWQGVVAAFLYSCFLVVLFWILKNRDVDMFKILGIG